MSTPDSKTKDYDYETTGHVWDGIEEYNKPLPRWWLWTFYATIVWGVGYTIAFPAWPLVQSATGGVLGYSTRGEVAAQIAEVEASQAGLRSALKETELALLAQNDDLHRFAVQAGAALFRNNCSQCHGSGAAGAVGYPNLLDDDWLWGGRIEEIAYSIRHGIRNDDDWDAHFSEMPAFGEILEEDEIALLVNHVQTMGQGGDPEAGAGGELYQDNCSSCHGVEGLGDITLGAPNLVDAIWLYGGDPETLTETITYSRAGVMPPWGERLGESGVRALAAYVHGKGGGVDEPVEAASD